MDMLLIKQLRERTGAGLMECKKTLSSFNNDLEKSIEFLKGKELSKADKKSGRSTLEGLVQGYLTEDKKAGALVEVNCETDFVAKNIRFKAFVNDILLLITQHNPKSDDELLSLQMTDERTVHEQLMSLITTFGENIQISRFTCFTTSGNSVVSYYVHKDYLTEGKLGVLLQASVHRPETLLQPAFDDLLKNILVHIAASTPRYVDRSQIPTDILEQQAAVFRESAVQEGKPNDLVEKIVQNRVEKFIKTHCLLEQGYVKDPDKTIHALLDEVNQTIGNETILIEQFACFVKGEES
ncbi:translation elongation factor Ts [Fredinandcohnia humi]